MFSFVNKSFATINHRPIPHQTPFLMIKCSIIQQLNSISHYLIDTLALLEYYALRPKDFVWGYSSAGRALAWHARGQRFDPA